MASPGEILALYKKRLGVSDTDNRGQRIENYTGVDAAGKAQLIALTALLRDLQEDASFSLSGAFEFGDIDFQELPGEPGLLQLRGRVPAVYNDAGVEVQAAYDEDLGIFDITQGEVAVLVEDQMDEANAESQAIQDAAETQRAETDRLRQLEDVRSNTAAEGNAAADRALAASTSAMEAYLQGTQLADARRLAAHTEARALLPDLVSPDREFFAGTGPGGFLDKFSQKFLGGPSENAEVVKKVFRPGDLAKGTSGITDAVAAGTADIQNKGTAGIPT